MNHKLCLIKNFLNAYFIDHNILTDAFGFGNTVQISTLRCKSEIVFACFVLAKKTYWLIESRMAITYQTWPVWAQKQHETSSSFHLIWLDLNLTVTIELILDNVNSNGLRARMKYTKILWYIHYICMRRLSLPKLHT